MKKRFRSTDDFEMILM